MCSHVCGMSVQEHLDAKGARGGHQMSSAVSLHLCLLRQGLSLNLELSNSVRLGGQ